MSFLSLLEEDGYDSGVNLDEIATEAEVLYRQCDEVSRIEEAAANLQRLEKMGFYTQEQRTFVTECINSSLGAPSDYVITTEGLLKSARKGAKAVWKAIKRIIKKIRDGIIYVLHGFSTPKKAKADRSTVKQIVKKIGKLKVAKVDNRVYSPSHWKRRVREMVSGQKGQAYSGVVSLYRADLDADNKRVVRAYEAVNADTFIDNISFMASALKRAGSILTMMDKEFERVQNGKHPKQQEILGKFQVVVTYVFTDVALLTKHFKKCSDLYNQQTDALNRKINKKMKKKDRKNWKKNEKAWASDK